jgi:predicted P-loop ATPase
MTHHSQLKPSSKRNPCPICGRVCDGDCRIGDSLVICHHGSKHHPPQGLRPGEVIERNGQRWAFTGESADGRASTFTLDKPLHAPARVVELRRQSRTTKPQPATITGPIELAQLPEPAQEPPAHLPDGQHIDYSPTQWVVVERKPDGAKAYKPHHQSPDGKVVKAKGGEPWPLWKEAEALKHGTGQWIAEAEGEKSAKWLQAGGLVAVSQPGHDHSPASIEARYRRLVKAGVRGVVYLADHDETGERKANQCATAAAAVGLPLLVMPAADVWPGLPRGGSIDDAPGTATERYAALLAAIPAALKRKGVHHPETASTIPAENGVVRLRPAQVVGLLEQRIGTIRLNTRSGDISANGELLGRNAIGRLYLKLSSCAETWPKEPTLDAVIFHAEKNAYDPVADYLNANAAEPLHMDQWNRLDQYLLGVDDPTAAVFLPRFLVSAVARTMEPGCDVRQTPVLVGPQWIGKTALGRILFGADYWVSGIGNLERDSLKRIHTAWGVELAELDGITRRSDQEALKAFLTETCDVYRSPYDRSPERHPRRFVFWGSSNGAALRDTTGSTRFVCLPVEKPLPLEWAQQHRDSLWARALQQYRSGFRWWECDQAQRDAISDRNASYQEADPWAELVDQYLRHRQVEAFLPVQIRELLERVGVPVERQDNRSAKRVRQLAEALGWTWERRRIGGSRQQGLWPPRPSLDHTVAMPTEPSQRNGSDALATPAIPNQEELEKSEGEGTLRSCEPAGTDAETFGPFGMAGMGTRPDPSQVNGSAVRTRCGHGMASGGSVWPASQPVGSGFDVVSDDGDAHRPLHARQRTKQTQRARVEEESTQVADPLGNGRYQLRLLD